MTPRALTEGEDSRHTEPLTCIAFCQRCAVTKTIDAPVSETDNEGASSVPPNCDKMKNITNGSRAVATARQGSGRGSGLERQDANLDR